MYRFFCFVLLSTLATGGAKRIDINGPLDRLIEKFNNKLRQVGTTTIPIPQIILDTEVKYSWASLLGADSLRRTADCWEEVKGIDILFDLSFGFGLLTIVLPHLEIAGKNMSGYARVRDNSVHLSWTMHLADEQCHAKLNDMRVEKMWNVEFGASRPDYDGTNFEEFFKLVVTPKLNIIIDHYFKKIEDSLQELCKFKHYLTSVDVDKLSEAFL